MEYEHHTNEESTLGDYYFQGQLHYDSEINLNVDPEELDTILSYLRDLAQVNNGINAIQVFRNETGEKLVFEDLLSGAEKDELIEAGVSQAELDEYHKIEVTFQESPALPSYRKMRFKQ